MGFLARALRRSSGVNRSTTVGPTSEWWALRGSMVAGQAVTPRSAMTIVAVYAAVRILGEGVGSLPLILYERLPNGGKRRATEHPLYTILHDAPNEEMTAIVFRETLQVHLGLWGNAYAQIVRDNGGRVQELWPLRPDRMTVMRDEQGRLRYVYQTDRGVVVLRADEVLHIPALGFDGLVGYSPIAMARRTLGLAMAAEEFGAKFFENDARPGVVLRYPGKLSEEAYRRLRQSWEEAHQGVGRAHRPAILEEGMDITTVGIPPQDAQFLETRKFQITEIARLYRIPPHMLADLDRATFSNIEHLGIEFVVHTLRPWLVRWEQAIWLQLLTPEERKRYFAEHLVDGLLRGDIKSRYEAYAIGRQNGWLSANDIRELENMNPIPGGDAYWTPMNMMAQSGERATLPSSTERRAQPREERDVLERVSGRRALMEAQFEVLLAALETVARREANDVANAIQRFLIKRNDVQGFLNWLAAFLEEHREFMQEKLGPVYRAYGRLVGRAAAQEIGKEPDYDEQGLSGFVAQYLETYGKRWVGSTEGQIRALLEEGDWDALLARTEEWRQSRAEREARRENIRFSNAVAKWALAALGVRRLVWVTIEESCPYCRHLDGRVVGIEGWFLAPGDVLPGDETEPEFVSKEWVGHPPAHDGCDCMITAA